MNIILLRRGVVVMSLLVVTLLNPERAAAKIEFLSIAKAAVVMYDAPSLKAEKLYVAGRYLPVEAVVNVEGWIKVRDSSGGLAWVRKDGLSRKRYVIVTKPTVDVYQRTSVSSSLVFQASENVVLEWIRATGTGWVMVRHQDGLTGYIRIDQVWGL